ncbi:helix-turn-helix domain-containing protein [Meiothermus granaticius]|uniref:helix-turn-helix domain-containing protein n=1 Tax=Meiothermus granaticius TaxID=863370 RepID=UPI000E65B434|nr:helix-turn-helix transcriptional regulator [Meiothermus granaticius]
MRQIMRAHRLSAYRLERALEGVLSPSTVYRFVSKKQKRVDLETLAWIIYGINSLCETKYKLSDFLRYEETPLESRGVKEE